MSRLIDADVVWRKLQYRLKAYGNGHMCKKYKEMLDSVPTAYDVEKVVEELEKRSNDVISNIFAYEEDDHTGIYNDGLSDGYDYSIDIVKRGGVE